MQAHYIFKLMLCLMKIFMNLFYVANNVLILTFTKKVSQSTSQYQKYLEGYAKVDSR